VVKVNYGYIDIFHIEIHGQRNDDQLNGGHQEHHGQDGFIPEQLAELFL
jgi:hypothetical protein